MESVMKHNADGGELVCYAAGEEVLRIIELDFTKASNIGNAVQAAYRKGRILGRLEMQSSIERYMDDLNANAELTGSRAGLSPVSPATEGSEVERRVGGRGS